MSDARETHCRHCTDCALTGNDDGIHSDAPHKWRKHRPEYTRRNHRGVRSYSTWERGECPMCFAAEHERAAIVAWLRDEETWRRVARGNLADFIERGEHLRGDDE